MTHSVPFTEAGPSIGPGALVSTPQGAPTEEGVAAVAPPPGATLTVSQDNSLAQYTGPDYRPSDFRREQLSLRNEQASTVDHNRVTADGSIVYGASGVHVEISDDRDYLSPEETTKQTQVLKISITETAKRIYKSYRKSIDRYNVSKGIVDDATESMKLSPSKELTQALKVVARGVPMTKKQAMIQGREQVMLARRT